ncbi:hypothetical protein EYC84_007263 [Monilinia fructicola]|uniref:Uncharacterized protein n=1 Tax=Monilinia fructicola TaxID=38448 RepID=A0A5M9K6P0_MONFR|nr:hypothetical protein EYC84_007263 [Monilinia fructicola]
MACCLEMQEKTIPNPAQARTSRRTQHSLLNLNHILLEAISKLWLMYDLIVSTLFFRVQLQSTIHKS